MVIVLISCFNASFAADPDAIVMDSSSEDLEQINDIVFDDATLRLETYNSNSLESNYGLNSSIGAITGLSDVIALSGMRINVVDEQNNGLLGVTSSEDVTDSTLLASIINDESENDVLGAPGDETNTVHVTTWEGLRTAINGDQEIIYIDNDSTVTNLNGNPYVIAINSKSKSIIGVRKGITISSVYGNNGGFFTVTSRSSITFNLVNLTFIGSKKSGNSGAMLISTDQSTINITNRSFIDNDCTGSGNIGGVFRFEGATGTRSSSNTNRVYIDNCYFEGSSATNHGGVICSRDSYLTIINSKFINNEAPFSGAVHMHKLDY